MANNCKNCGAPIIDSKCHYCGTIHYDLTVLDTSRNNFLKIKTPMGIIEGKMSLLDTRIDAEYSSEIASDWAGHVIRGCLKPTVRISLDLICSEGFSVIKEKQHELLGKEFPIKEDI